MHAGPGIAGRRGSPHAASFYRSNCRKRVISPRPARKPHAHKPSQMHVSTPAAATYIVHHQTFDSLAAFLRRQPGVVDAEWDRCIGKLDLWPGHSTIGLRVLIDGLEHERCYRVQEGIPGTINLFGWRPKVRATREHLQYQGARACTGFVEEQRRHCARR